MIGIDTYRVRLMSRFAFIVVVFCLLCGLSVDGLQAQNDKEVTLNHVEQSFRQQLEDSTAELSQLRKEMAEQQVPLNQKLNELEDQLIEVRGEYQQTIRLLDGRTLDLSNLRAEIKSRQDEKTYLSNLLSEYLRNFETRLHIAELQRYQEPLDAAKLASENSDMNDIDVYKTQASLLTVSLERLNDALGGTRFNGKAIDASGLVKTGSFILVGPAAFFRSDDGTCVGTAEQRLGSLEPTVFGFESQETAQAAADTITASAGRLPLDPTLGNAHKIEATQETLIEHIKKGGVVMYPILALAAAALLVALLKWLQLARLRRPSQKRITALVQAVAEYDPSVAAKAKAIGGPTGEMLMAGVEHIREPRELVEEVMYEKILTTKLQLQRWLPFVAISASSAPLLGLLGTVTGIINTFKLITVFGSGDVKMLSGGISEALITTEYGLIVAIPSLLLHAFLSRKAKGLIDQMEKAAIAFINQIAKTPYRREETEEEGQNGRQFPEFLRYAQDSAGAMMDRSVVSVGTTATVNEAISMIRAAAVDEDLHSVFVVDEQGKYVGDLRIPQLLTRPEQARIETFVDTHTHFVRVDTHRHEVKNLFHQQHNLVTVPVLDRDDRLVGRICRNGNGIKL